MKKITLLLLMTCTSVFSQFSTGLQTFTTGFSAKVDVNASLVTLTINAPSDRWFGLSFSNSSISGMNSATIGDLVAFDGVNLTDRSLGGIGVYDLDTNQDWTITSNTTSGTTRTLIATRALNTGEASDVVFTNSASTIFIAWVRGSSATFTLQPHGGLANAGRATQPISLSVLRTEDFSLKAASIYPNPSNGTFRIQTKTALAKVNVYGQTGNFIKTIEVKNNSQDVEVSLKGIATGLYLLELQNETEKSWKKIIVE
jgi:hypothetical protein